MFASASWLWPVTLVIVARLAILGASIVNVEAAATSDHQAGMSILPCRYWSQACSGEVHCGRLWTRVVQGTSAFRKPQGRAWFNALLNWCQLLNGPETLRPCRSRWKNALDLSWKQWEPWTGLKLIQRLRRVFLSWNDTEQEWTSWIQRYPKQTLSPWQVFRSSIAA